MSGWEDIDGSLRMSGSPGILDCFDIEFQRLLGELPGQVHKQGLWSNGFDQMIELAEKIGDADLLERLKAGRLMIEKVRAMFTYQRGKQVSARKMRKAIELLERP